MTSETQLLALSNVSKAYGDQAVLREVSLTLAAGEIVGLVGLNGAGKTTLLRAILDLTAIDAGSITIRGVSHRKTAARAALTYLGERFSPPAFATGNELLRHLMSLQGLAFDSAAAAAEAAALQLDPEALSRPAREYSKGMAQKLGLIAGILAARPLLLLDEPMSGLDPQARALFKARLAARREAGAGVFFSTHSLIDVHEMCDRVALLHNGTIRHFDGAADLIAASGKSSLDAAFLAFTGAPPGSG